MVKVSAAKEEIKAMRERLSRNGLLRLESFEHLMPKQLSQQTFQTLESPNIDHHLTTLESSDQKERITKKLSKIHSKSGRRKRSVIYDSCETLKFHQTQVDNDNRFSKYRTDDELKYLRSSLKQLNLLHTIGSYQIIKEFKYPSTMPQIIKFIKENDLDLFEKIRQTRNLFMKRFIDNGELSMQNLQTKDKDFIRLFTMNERQQVVILKEWLEYMIERFVKPEPQLGIQRLNQEQLLIVFTLGDLRDQLSIECKERGEIIDKVLALLFDMFNCYESSFDRIVEDEVQTLERGKKQQAQKKEEMQKGKDKELKEALMKVQEFQVYVDDKDNQIKALIAQRKAMDGRFTIMRNLVENLAFTYRNKLEKEVTKERGERNIIKNFVYQLRELKRFSTKDEKEFDDLEKFDENQAMNNMKRKVNRQTQTVFDYRKKLGSMVKVQSNASNRMKPLSVRKNKRNQSNTNVIENQIQETNDSKLEIDDSNEQSSYLRDSPKHLNRIDNEMSIQNQSSSSFISSDNDHPRSKNKSDLQNVQTQNDNNEDDDNEAQNVSYENQNYNQEMDLSEEDNKNQEEQYSDENINADDDEEENGDDEDGSKNEIFQVIEQYAPDQLLEMINYYQQHALMSTDDKEIQTEQRHPSQQHFQENQPKLMKKQTFQRQEIGKSIGSDSEFAQLNQKVAAFDFSSKGESGDEGSPEARQLYINCNPSLIKQNSEYLATPTTLIQKKISNFNLNNLKRQTTNRTPSMRGSEEALLNPLGGTTGLTIDDMMEEIQNLNIQDLDILYSSEKQYNKKSMQFMQQLIQQLRRTKSFRILVDKSAKEKIREEEKKEKIKEEMIFQKKGTLTSIPKSPDLSKKAPIVIQNTKAKTQIMKEDNKLLKNRSFKSSAVIEERISSESSRMDSATPKKKKNFHRDSTQKSAGKNENSAKKSIGGKKNSTQSDKPEKSQFAKKESVKREDKGIQVDTMTDQFEMMKKSLLGYSQSSIEEETKDRTLAKSASQPLIEPGEGSSVLSDFRNRLKQKILMVGKMSIAFQNSPVDPIRQLGSNKGSIISMANQPRIVPQPFNLGQERQNNKLKQTTHAMSRFLPLFVEKYKSNDKKFLNVNPMSVKQLVKFIISFYYDKAQGAKDSNYTRQQSLPEFMYDQLFNKYGIANITEKKLKEILLTIMLHKSSNPTIGLFFRFLGLSKDCYSNDDLGFLYKVNKMMVNGDSFQPVIRREINIESQNVIFNNAYEVFNQYFSKKLQPKTLQALQDKLQASLKTVNMQTTQNGLILVASEIYFEALLNCYKDVKEQIYKQIKMQFTNENDSPTFDYPQCLFEKCLDYDDFLKKLKSLSTRGQIDMENTYQIFENNRIMLGSQSAQVKEEDKRINLEGFIYCIKDNQTLVFIYTVTEQVVVLSGNQTKSNDPSFTNIKGMHYNQDGSLIILSHTEGGIISIKDCEYSDSKIVQPHTFFKGFKMDDNVVLASRYSNIACYDDPTSKDCKLNLHMSNDGKATDWWLLFRNVNRYDLIRDQHKVGAVAMGYEGMSKSQTLFYFPDIAKSLKFKKLAHTVHEYFIVNDRYLYILKTLERMNGEFLYFYDFHSPKEFPTSIKFLYNTKISTTVELMFLPFIKDKDTTLMVAQNLNEVANKERGILYTSDQSRQKFAISLGDVNIIDEEFPDIYKAKSMEFVLIANKRVQHNDEENAQTRMEKFSKDNQFTVSSTESNIETVISYNNGGSWHQIEVAEEPDMDCSISSHCHLNLYLEQSFSGVLRAPQITSFEKNGFGIIIANGNRGKSLSNRVDTDFDTFITTDGGFKWRKLADGPHLIKVLDDIGMLVLVPYNDRTSEVMFSLNYGFTQMETLQFTETPYLVQSIVKDAQNPFKIYIYGESEGKYELFSVDFTNILKSKFKECSGQDEFQNLNSDYELYKINDHYFRLSNAYKGCYMGAEQTFFRKKPDSTCYLPLSPHTSNHEISRLMHHQKIKVSCPCSEVDYECDEGFEKMEVDSYQCHPIDHMKTEIAKAEVTCVFGEYFYLPSGYRKIPGNYCLDGLIKDKKKKIYCAEGMKDNNLKVLIWIALTSAFIYVLYLMKWLYQEEITQFSKWFGQRYGKYLKRNDEKQKKNKEDEEDNKKLLK